MRRWIIVVVLALLGLAATPFLMPIREASVHWGFRLGRDQMTARARELAAFHGIDVRTWPALCRSSAATRRVIFARVFDRPPHPLITVGNAEVAFTDPRGALAVLITLSANGDPLSFEVRHRPGVRLPAAGPPARVAAETLRRYAGEFLPSFQIENEGIRQGNDEVYSWNWKTTSETEISLRFESVFESGALRSARLLPSYPSRFVERYEQERNQFGFLATGMIVAVALTFFLAFPAFFRGIARRRFPVPRAVRAALLALVCVLLGAWTGSVWIDLAFNSAGELTTVSANLAGVLIPQVLLALTAALFYGAGRTLVSTAELGRWRGFELLLDGRVFTRPVGEGLAAGILAGCAISAVPLVVSLPFPFTVATPIEERSVYGLVPWATAFLGLHLQDLAALFVFLWPWRQARRRQWLGWLVFIPVGVIGLATFRGIFDFLWIAPVLLAAASILGALVLAYRSFGLLAVLISGMVPPALYLAAALGLQPSAALHATIPWVLGIPVLLLLAGAAIAWRGQPVDAVAEIEREQNALVEAGSDRDRLRAEFNVARKAQLGMLPDLPPVVEGLAVAGSCQPAREVGGDLYDFFLTADGRYGFCVADVSGKGVPASLYMAMTKGLIASAIHDSSDPGQILSWLNRHWVDHGKRRMFATMAMCFYDPAARTLEYVRAGHNPVLHFTGGEGRYLAPAGVGLGLASVRMFDRALRRETIRLTSGDLVVLYSDGIVEAMNLANEQFGEDRLLDTVRDCQDFSAQETEQEISRRVHLFMGAAPPHDDMTLLVLKVL